MVVRQVVPRVAVGAVVLADGAPLALAHVRAPQVPVAGLAQPVLEPAEPGDPFTFCTHFDFSWFRRPFDPHMRRSPGNRAPGSHQYPSRTHSRASLRTGDRRFGPGARDHYVMAREAGGHDYRSAGVGRPTLSPMERQAGVEGWRGPPAPREEQARRWRFTRSAATGSAAVTRGATGESIQGTLPPRIPGSGQTGTAAKGVPHGHCHAKPRIVVGVDERPASLAALRWAAREAGLRAAWLQVVQAWERARWRVAPTPRASARAARTRTGPRRAPAGGASDELRPAQAIPGHRGGGRGPGHSGAARPRGGRGQQYLTEANQ